MTNIRKRAFLHQAFVLVISLLLFIVACDSSDDEPDWSAMESELKERTGFSISEGENTIPLKESKNDFSTDIRSALNNISEGMISISKELRAIRVIMEDQGKHEPIQAINPEEHNPHLQVNGVVKKLRR